MSDSTTSPAAATAPDREQCARDVLGHVQDPEIPVISVIDLGVIRSIRSPSSGSVAIGLSPTYSGCPAAGVIRANVVAALRGAGFHEVVIEDVLSPAWGSSAIGAAAREKLRQYGIAPPDPAAEDVSPARSIHCPRCGSLDTRQVSAFGSTPCKALHRCNACSEPFEYFKCT